MLANRSDGCNPGDVTGDAAHLFCLNLVENTAIENPENIIRAIKAIKMQQRGYFQVENIPFVTPAHKELNSEAAKI